MAEQPDGIIPTPDAFERIQDTVQAVEQDGAPESGGRSRYLGRRNGSPLVVGVRNDTDADVPRFGVLGIKEPLETSAPSGQEFVPPLRFAGVKPTSNHQGNFVIAREKIKKGQIGVAVLYGLSQAVVDMQSDGDPRADITADNVQKLTSGSEGAARIVWAEPGTGEKKAVVLVLDRVSSGENVKYARARWSPTVGDVRAVEQEWNQFINDWDDVSPDPTVWGDTTESPKLFSRGPSGVIPMNEMLLRVTERFDGQWETQIPQSIAGPFQAMKTDYDVDANNEIVFPSSIGAGALVMILLIAGGGGRGASGDTESKTFTDSNDDTVEIIVQGGGGGGGGAAETRLIFAYLKESGQAIRVNNVGAAGVDEGRTNGGGTNGGQTEVQLLDSGGRNVETFIATQGTGADPAAGSVGGRAGDGGANRGALNANTSLDEKWIAFALSGQNGGNGISGTVTSAGSLGAGGLPGMSGFFSDKWGRGSGHGGGAREGRVYVLY